MSMEHELFQDQQSPSSDHPPSGNILSYGSSSGHTSTATSNANLTATSPSIDPSASSYSPSVAPRGRPPRLGASVSNYRPIHSQNSHAVLQQSNLGPTAAPYYAAQQTQAQNSGQQPQQQHYLSQPMSPTLYYPVFPQMHQQTTSPNAYNVNQGYIGPVPTSAGPSMPVTTYAYPHPYAAHVSDPQLHSFAYPGVGGMSAASLPLYPELDPQGHQQQMQNRTAGIPGYVPVMTTTAPPFAYSIPAYAPSGGSLFTPQYAAGHPYGYAPQQPQSFPPTYGQTHQGPRPTSLPPSQQPQAPMQGSSQAGFDLPPGPPSPLVFSNSSQGASIGYSQAILSPSPGVGSARTVDFIGRSTLGLNPRANNLTSNYGSAVANSSGDGSNTDRTGRAVDSTWSTVPVGIGVGVNSESDVGAHSQEPSSSQRDRPVHINVSDNRPDRADQQQATVKGERSDWVMWVGNVPGDANLNELYTFFGRGPPVPGEERSPAGAGNATSTSMENVPQVEGAALEPTPKDELDVTITDAGVGVGGVSGVVSVFLISRSNCAFVNYISEASLHRGVDFFNGRPLRNPQVDPRCPKLVCRVRKKGDDVKAGVGGQRGVGTHTRWVKEKKAAEFANQADGNEGPEERPPFVHGGPAGNAKKSSSGSSGSYASTTSSLLLKYFPSRYFILKSLTQDLDLSVECGLWATQVHNQDVLDQAYRTSQNVYLIFGVNKSGEFFGYAKMDGPISQVERTPSIEWASREPLVSPGSGKVSPVVVRGAPSQPTIREEERERGGPEQEEHKGLDLARPPRSDKESGLQSSSDANTARENWGRQDPHRLSFVPSSTAEQARHSLPDEFPSRRGGRKVGTSLHHQVSEPIRSRQREASDRQGEQAFAQALEASDSSRDKTDSMISPNLRNPSTAHLLTWTALQDSPDPLTPGEDQKLHSLDNVKSPPSSAQSSRQAPSQQGLPDGTSSEAEPGRDYSKLSITSAPAIMGRGHRPLSASTPIVPSETWDEQRKGANMWTREPSIEEDVEGGEDTAPIPPTTSQSLPLDGLLAQVKETDEPIQLSRLDIPAAPLAFSHLDTPGLHPDAPEHAEAVANPNEAKNTSEAPILVGGREEGWGIPFKVKWIRTDPLPFHRTRHLRNPWNHDREIKVSRDGTEVEPGVGQRLIEEWDRADTGPIASRIGLQPTSPLSRGPPSPIQTFIPRGRGRGRVATGVGWVQRDTGQ